MDDGGYEVVRNGTFVLNGRLTFHYRIHGDTIMFEPVIPVDCSTKQCREDHAYAVVVAQPGARWKRIG